ncbi:MAG: hypothetical protein K6C97_04395 [Treponema sp.]|nr:hypothetical protein [Treponema sp.]
MKKIVMGAAALLCAASMFAVDFAATVKMAGDIAGGAVTEATNDATYIWKLNKNDQKDNDALKLSVSGDKAGANFQFFYTYEGGEAAALKVRSTSIWVKPIDQLKITIGDVSCGTFGNKLDYWKDPIGQNYNVDATDPNHMQWDGVYSSYASVEGAGIAAELTPIEGLTVVAGIAAGAGNNFITFTENQTRASVAAYGASVMYNLSSVAGIPVNIGVSWRDAGNEGNKVLAIGADYGNAYADGFYGMINARMLFDRGLKNGSYWYGSFFKTNDKEVALSGIAFDNFFQYKAGAMTIALRAPFVLRGLAGTLADGTKLDASNDPSYMFWSAKFSYALDGLTVYVAAGSDYDDGRNAWVFWKENAADTFNVTIHPGVTFNVGACAFDIGARIDINDAAASSNGGKYRPISWSIPFTATIGF